MRNRKREDWYVDFCESLMDFFSQEFFTVWLRIVILIAIIGMAIMKDSLFLAVFGTMYVLALAYSDNHSIFGYFISDIPLLPILLILWVLTFFASPLASGFDDTLTFKEMKTLFESFFALGYDITRFDELGDNLREDKEDIFHGYLRLNKFGGGRYNIKGGIHYVKWLIYMMKYKKYFKQITETTIEKEQYLHDLKLVQKALEDERVKAEKEINEAIHEMEKFRVSSM